MPRAASARDCLAHAVEQGAERLVDIATLTGAIVTTLRTRLRRAHGPGRRVVRGGRGGGPARRRGLWRLPHADYAELIKGRSATSSTPSRPPRRAPSRRRSSCGALSATCRGRIWTSPAPHGTPARPTRPRAGRATACGFSFGSPPRDRSRRRYTGMAFAGEVFPEWYWGRSSSWWSSGCRSRRPRSPSTSRSGAGSDGWPGLSAPHLGRGDGRRLAGDPAAPAR